MLQLYTSDYCQYCKKVEAHMKELGIEYERMNVGENPSYREAVIHRGGKMQIPFLVDEEKGAAMYESDDIIAYLDKTYGYAEET